MLGAVFFLAVNFVVAMSFSVVFVVVSTRSRSRRAALWFAAGFGVASLSALCELAVAFTAAPMFFALCAFATVLTGMLLLRIGLGEMYGLRISWWAAALFLLASIAMSIAIYDLPRGTPLQAFAYQTPFAWITMVSAIAVLSSARRLVIDRVLGILMLVTGVHFFAKASLAVIFGAGQVAKDYVGTHYALISQSMTGVLMVAVGLTLLSVLVLEIMAEERSSSETDALSGLANRRGFDRQVKAAFSRSNVDRHAVILCDLDHFKSINDTYGHHAGDAVIRAFADTISHSAPGGAILARIGGEEFAICLGNMPLDVAVLFAQTLRAATAAMIVPGMPATFRVTASFGVAPFTSIEDFEAVIRSADAALYAAKRGGRNRVQAAPEPFLPSRAAHLRPVR
ncbi:MAG: GGDEF domain-containing protein [Neorhizobium sp.]|jgi:diguanylate cyclase (GGDEF)-like protein|nr:GGDEF domain-containing protein [Neorhizobium sp.]